MRMSQSQGTFCPLSVYKPFEQTSFMAEEKLYKAKNSTGGVESVPTNPAPLQTGHSPGR